MATHLTRGELKRDELGEAVGAGVHWLDEHRRAILIGLASLVGVALAVWGVLAWSGHRDRAANDLLGEALRLANAEVVASGAKPEDPAQPTFPTAAARDAAARPLFERLVERYGSTDAGAAGHLWLGRQAFASGDRAAAHRHWTAYLDETGEGALAAAVRRDLWMLDRLEGKGETALAEIRAALGRQGGALPPDVLLWELAETESALGRSEDARATWQRLVDEHADSPYTALARRRLAAGGAAS